MSELFGVSASNLIDISFAMDQFSTNSKIDESSWGVGFYRQGEMNQPYAAIVKEPISAKYSIFNYFLQYGYIKSDLFLSNIRLASVGAKVHLNTHPFELMLDPHPNSYMEKSWVFTHNGTALGIRNNPEFFTLIKPHGNTDSEYIFCYFIEQLRKVYSGNGYTISVDEKIDIIETAAGKIRKAYPKNLNFIMSDGYRLYAYYSGYETAGGLWYLSTELKQEKVSMSDEEDGMVIRFVSKESNIPISLISARPLTPSLNGNWERFPMYTLKVFENGVMLR